MEGGKVGYLKLALGVCLGFKLTVLLALVVFTPIEVTGCSPTVGVKALLEYLSAVAHKTGSLEWMSAIIKGSSDCLSLSTGDGPSAHSILTRRQ